MKDDIIDLVMITIIAIAALYVGWKVFWLFV